MALRVAKVAAAVATLEGAIVLCGWAFDARSLTSVLPGQATMKPNTALAFVLGGTALWLSLRGGRAPRGVAIVSSAIVFAVGALTMSEYGLGWSAGIDDLLFRAAVRAEGARPPGRMAPATALSWTLLGAALLLLTGVQRPALRRWVPHVVFLPVLIGSLAILGYGFGAPALYTVSEYTSMAMPTAAMIVALGIGIVCARPDEGPLRLALVDTAGGAVLRRVIPATVVTVVALAAARLAGQRYGLYGTEFGLALMVAGSILVLGVVIWRTAARLDHLDRAQQALLGQLEQRVEERTAELARSNSDLEEFASIAAHDLRSPLTTIGGFASLLADSSGGLTAENQLLVDRIVRGVDRMQALVDDLLAYAKVSTVAAPAPVDCGGLVDEVVSLLDADISATHAQLRVAPLPTVEGDDSQLRQLFSNLIGNAIKFRRPDAEPLVEIDAEHQSRGWLFTVSDNGIGIDPRDQDRVFKMFQRLHPSDRYTGTGLGLAICRRVVENHGGRIWIEASPSGGTSFRFTLPAPSAARTAP